MTAETVAYIACGIAVLNFAYTVIEKSFGGGNALAAKFHKLDKDTATAMEALAARLVQKVDTYEDNYQVGFNKLVADNHALEKAFLELRARIAEEYIHKGGLADIKDDMKDGFAKVDKRMGELQDMIMWAQPQQARALAHQQ